MGVCSPPNSRTFSTVILFKQSSTSLANTMARQDLRRFSSRLLTCYCLLGCLLIASGKPQPNITVSKQGDGNYRTLGEAVKNIPTNQHERYVIYVKSGLYKENVVIARSNITLIGDGMGKTIIRSYRNNVTGSSIKDSGAVVILGDNFIVRDITFENASGPKNHQAVALRSDSDKSVFYFCEFLGYQDTLYVNGGRQFFRECNIYGTIDFIFGDAAMVLQKCNIKFRQPLPTQRNVITAQGREIKSKNTGIVIHNCMIAAAAGFRLGSVQCFLGRPWKQFSRTIVMQSDIGSIIDPKGWLESNAGLFLDTLEYREYDNKGQGAADQKKRVQWRGYKLIHNAKEIKQYTVAIFINGDEWLPSTGVPYAPSFI